VSNQYSISTTNNITFIQLFRKLNLSEISALFEELQQSNPTDLRLWDISSSDVSFTDEQIKTIAAIGKTQTHLPSKVALVAPSDYDVGIAGVFEVFKETKEIDIKVFRDKSKAEQWLLGELVTNQH